MRLKMDIGRGQQKLELEVVGSSGSGLKGETSGNPVKATNEVIVGTDEVIDEGQRVEQSDLEWQK
jgi:hypothetical protein